MPRQTVWFIRASLIYLLLGFCLGTLILAQKGVPYNASIWVLLPMHMEFLLLGWLLQLVLGMAFWIFPRFGSGAPRGREGLVWASFFVLNAGIVLTALQLWIPLLLVAGRSAEALGVILYMVGSWGRVKPLMT